MQDSPLIKDLSTLPHRMRLIDSRTSESEVIDKDTALERIRESGLDVIFVNRTEGQPPVYKIIDYSKFLFDKKKEERTKNRQQKLNERTPKEMRFRQQISEHDYKHKLDQVISWLPKHDVWVELKLDRTTRPGLPRGVDFNQLPRWGDFILNRVARDLVGKADIGRTIVGERIIKMIVKPL